MLSCIGALHVKNPGWSCVVGAPVSCTIVRVASDQNEFSHLNDPNDDVRYNVTHFLAFWRTKLFFSNGRRTGFRYPNVHKVDECFSAKPTLSY